MSSMRPVSPITNTALRDRPNVDEGASVGLALAHDSAARHVQGSAAYIDDFREPVGTAHVAPGCAAATRGTIRSLDLGAVRASPGVLAVLTAEDIPGSNDCSPSLGDDPILASGEILFHGQVVFAVVAETRDAARHASRRARIDVEPVAPRVTVDDGLAARDEVLPAYEFLRGEPAQAISGAAHRLEGRVRIGGQEHFYLEGQAALAIPGEDDEMRIHSSTQHPSEVQNLVARMLGVPGAAVVCECRRMGGAFGGKESQAAQWACLAALAAHVTGRAAKIRLDRDDDMAMTGKRHDFRVDWRCGFDSEGVLAGVDVEFNARCGYSADLSLGVNDRAMFHADNAYYYPAARIHSRRVRTDTVSNTAFRGFGGPQGMLFAERMMDSVAITLGLDPLEVRKRNLYAPGRDVTPYGMRMADHVTTRLIQRLERTSGYAARRRAIARFNAGTHRSRRGGTLRRGIALTPVKFGVSFTLVHLNQAGALVHVFTDGSVQVNHGGTEMGQGLYVKVAQVVAEEFGIGIDRVRITATRTDKVPNTTPTAASSGSDLNGMAAQRAARTIRRRLAGLAARLFQVREADVAFGRGMVRIGTEAIPFARLADLAFTERVSLSATGFYATPKISWDRDTTTGHPFLYFAGGAACSEVTVDVETGETRVDRCGHPPRRRAFAEPGHRHGPDRGRIRAGDGVAHDRRAGLRPGRPAAHPRTLDVQDPDVLGRARRFQGGAVRARPQSRADNSPIQGGRRAAADARALGVFRHHPCGREPRAGARAATRCAGDAGSDCACGGWDAFRRRMTAGTTSDPDPAPRHRLTRRGIRNPCPPRHPRKA